MSEQDRWDAVETLWESDEEDLLLTLAARARAEEEGIAEDALQQWNPSEDAFGVDVEGGIEWTAMMKEFGQRWWRRLEPKLYDLLCNEESEGHDELMDALGDGAKALAVALAGMIVAPGVVPAVAIVIATLAAKKIWESGLEVVCEMWQESLEARGSEAAPETAGG